MKIKGSHSILAVFLMFLLTSCYPSKSGSQKDVDKAEKKLEKAKQDGKLDSKILETAINAYNFYLLYFPYDSSSSYKMYREGELEQLNGQYKDAVSTLRSIEKLYPESPKIPDANFLTATVYEHNLNDQDSADSLYASILVNYSTSKAAQQTRSVLESKGISAEDFAKKYSGLFLKLENAHREDSIKRAFHYHPYWKQ